MDTTRISKFLSLVLRHKPEAAGIELDAEGWADVAELVDGMAKAGRAVDMAQLIQVVESNDKQRFAFNDDHSRIRAVQGHSRPVALGYAPSVPPDRLYHGTVARFLPAIRKQGLKPGRRQHVHLSLDRATAEKVGARRGRPVILTVDSHRMARDRYVFYLADNGVWLTDRVPAEYIIEWP
ncbi:MAG: RNA 2'-phosphotransferase [Alphaproteobacteria bacterium]|nr:RNA 2'-phosphotransferase [Alphaproteobacteria bacterium]